MMYYTFKHRLIFRAEARQSELQVHDSPAPHLSVAPEAIASSLPVRPEKIIFKGEIIDHIPAKKGVMGALRKKYEKIFRKNPDVTSEGAGYADAILAPEEGDYSSFDKYVGKPVKYMVGKEEFFGSILSYEYDDDLFYIRDDNGMRLNIKRKYVRLAPERSFNTPNSFQINSLGEKSLTNS